MEVTPLNRAETSSPSAPEQSDLDRNEQLRSALSAVRTLNNLDTADREFSVVRDAQSQKFVIRVVDRTTGDVIDQFPPEDILNLLSQLGTPGGLSQGADK